MGSQWERQPEGFPTCARVKMGMIINPSKGIYRWKHMAVCQNLRYPCSSHQNSWDLWMFIPLKMVLIGIDPYLYENYKQFLDDSEMTILHSPCNLTFFTDFSQSRPSSFAAKWTNQVTPWAPCRRRIGFHLFSEPGLWAAAKWFVGIACFLLTVTVSDLNVINDK